MSVGAYAKLRTWLIMKWCWPKLAAWHLCYFIVKGQNSLFAWISFEWIWSKKGAECKLKSLWIEKNDNNNNHSHLAHSTMDQNKFDFDLLSCLHFYWFIKIYYSALLELAYTNYLQKKVNAITKSMYLNCCPIYLDSDKHSVRLSVFPVRIMITMWYARANIWLTKKSIAHLLLHCHKMSYYYLQIKWIGNYLSKLFRMFFLGKIAEAWRQNVTLNIYSNEMFKKWYNSFIVDDGKWCAHDNETLK